MSQSHFYDTVLSIRLDELIFDGMNQHWIYIWQTGFFHRFPAKLASSHLYNNDNQYVVMM